MFKKTKLLLASFSLCLLVGCAGMPSLSVTPVDAEVNLGDKQEHNQTALVQTNTKADQVNSTVNNLGLSFEHILLIAFLAGLAMPSFHEVIRLVKEKKNVSVQEVQK